MASNGKRWKQGPPGHAAVTPKGWLDSDAEVKAISHPGIRRLYRISGVTGLRLEVRETGSKTWRLNYKTKSGTPRTYVIGQYPETTLGDARKLAEAARARVILGGDPQMERIQARATDRAEKIRKATAHGTTIVALTNRALGLTDEPHQMRPLMLKESTLKEWRRLAAADILPDFPAPLQAADLTRDRIRSWGGRIARRSGYTANRAFELLRRVYSRAVEDDILNATPFVKLPFPFDGEVQSDRVLSTGEIKALVHALVLLAPAQPDYVAATRLLLLTGVRRAMVLGMVRSELDGLGTPERRWVIPGGFYGRSKSKRVHVVPLSAAAEAVVAARLAVADKGQQAPLFPLTRPGKGSILTWSSAFVGTLRDTMDGRLGAPAPRWTIHNLRHTIGTHMREDLGVRADIVAMILGHAVAGAAVTRVYDRAELLTERRAALEAWATWVEKISTPAPRGPRTTP